MRMAHPLEGAPDRPKCAHVVLDGMLQHVPRMELPFDGDFAQANGVDLPVVVINLPHRADRWQALSQRMSHIGLTKLIRAPAVEGVRLPDKQVAALLRSPRDATDGAPCSHLTLTRPAIGCFLSHLAIWRWVLGTNISRVLVLEDDAVPAAHCSAARFRKIVSSIPEEAGLVLLGRMIMGGLADRPQEFKPGKDLLFQRHLRLSHQLRSLSDSAQASATAPLAYRSSDQHDLDRTAAHSFSTLHRPSCLRTRLVPAKRLLHTVGRRVCG